MSTCQYIEFSDVDICRQMHMNTISNEPNSAYSRYRVDGPKILLTVYIINNMNKQHMHRHTTCCILYYLYEVAFSIYCVFISYPCFCCFDIYDSDNEILISPIPICFHFPTERTDAFLHSERSLPIQLG